MPSSPEHRVKILLVDDQPNGLLALEAVLESLGQDLVKARSGPAALKHLLEEDFAVILLDVKMPGMDGFETATLIRERDRSRHTPIIFLTAYKSEEHLFRGYFTGAVDYLFKPIVPEVLRSKVSVFVELSKKTAEIRRLNENLQQRLRQLEAVHKEQEVLYAKVTELDQLKSQFFANVSHELRTPLTLVLGPIEELLRCGNLPQEHRKQLGVVTRNARVLLKHVNDLLDVSKLEAGKMDLHYVETDLAMLVRLTASQFELAAEQRGIRLTVDAPSEVIVQADLGKLQRVLLNLLSNAFKFVPDGGSVVCEARVEGKRAILVVQDSGPGVPPDQRELIFERFRQVNDGEPRRFGGAGLGLSIAKEFVELHGGAIRVGEAPEGGALFTVEIPSTAPAGIPVLSAHQEMVETLALTSQTLAELYPVDGSGTDDLVGPAGRHGADLALILVVEDNREMNRFLCDVLAREYRVACAWDGLQGLEKALTLRPDLILADLMMPRMSGEEMLDQLRAHRETSEIPIVLITAKNEGLCAALLRRGAQDFLTKPFSVEELTVRVANLVSLKRARDVLQRELATRGQDLESLAKEVAQRKRGEEAARNQAEFASRAKDEFLATVSHELRTPLTAILGWARLLRSGNLDPETGGRALETIERNAKVQAQLINDILDVSRIITGKLRLDARPVELSRVVEAAIDAVRPAAEANHIRLQAVLDPQAGPALGDPDRLQQVLWNLLSNALKFTPKGGRVQVQLLRINSHVEITVTDDGKGISPEFLPYVFERFRQADGSSTRAHGGLGLGLAIVRHLVELHGGSVHAESQGEGKGSTFIVKLPLMVVSPHTQVGPAAERHHPSAEEGFPSEQLPDLDGLEVLVVDDEPDARELLTMVLGKCGARVTAVGSASEALDVLAREQPDVLLSDIEMPGEDGYTFIRKVRSLGPEQGGLVPAAALTAYARVEDRVRALSCGFQMHVPKPVEPVELAAVVANLAGQLRKH